MTIQQTSSQQLDQHPAEVCGLFCSTCPIYLSGRDNPQLRQKIAADMGISAETFDCKGCGTERCHPYCQWCMAVA